jgi:predicted ArsR family transcriptional regulator
MPTAHFDKRFFESTRGQIVALLRTGNRTVNQLVEELGLTDNAIRAHLLSLERDSLVVQKGMIKGYRKPHYVYGLTEEGRELFPRSYDSLLSQLLTTLKDRFTPDGFRDLLKDVGRKIGVQKPTHDDIHERAKLAAVELYDFGGSPTVSEKDGEIWISSDNCPFAEVVSEHPETCKIVESMVGEIVKAPVEEKCIHDGSPKCSFVIRQTEGSA